MEKAVALHCIPGLTYAQKLTLGGLEPDADAVLARWAGAQRFRDRTFQALRERTRRSIDSFLRWLEEPAHHACTIFDDAYPHLLKEIADPPFVLTYVGHDPESPKCISIVGTREADGQGLKAAGTLAAECACAGRVVVSGFVHGIDRAAHEGCQAADGETWAVLGAGLDCLRLMAAPPVVRFLLRHGVFLSEFHPYATPVPWRFAARNRIISGLSAATVLVQAPRHSEALDTAHRALEQGRVVLVHRAGLTGELGVGGMRLVEDGAAVVGSLAEMDALMENGSLS